MKNLLCLSIVLAAASVASAAAPTVNAVQTDLGGGLYGTTISLSDGSSVGSWAANLTITGNGGAVVNELKAFSALTVNTESDATNYQGIAGSGYTKLMDTWYYNSAFTTVLPAGVAETANGFRAHIGTAAGVNWGDVNALYVVSTVGALDYSGTIGRASQNYNVAGSIAVPVPEPTTLGLLAGGSLLMLRRRRASR